MKRIIASAGLIAVGTSALQAAYAPGLSPLETAKPWSISATVRGFYDDNYVNAPSSFPGDVSSFGFEFSPAVSINIPLEQSYFGAAYIYTVRYYEARPNNNFDQTHELTLKADHRFSERYKIQFRDAFAYSQEPDIIQETGVAAATFQRTDANALRNRARIDFSAQVTELFELTPGYQLTWYDFLDSNFIDSLGNLVVSRSATLDRFEHLIHLDGRYLLREDLVGLVGYQFGMINYNGDQPIFVGGPNGSIRDSQSQYGYVGADYTLSSQLNVAANAGVQYTTYDSLSGDELSPYFDLNGRYTYLPGSYMILGIRQTRNATDEVGSSINEIVRDQESTLLYASVNHRITRELTASVLGQYQRGVFTGGSLNGEVDNFMLLGINFEYRINENWAVEAGYNFDRLDSDVPGRSFTRNRVYLGASATY